MEIKLISKNEDQTKMIAAALGKSLTSGQVIAFKGDLGTGKTRFIQGIARGLSIKDKISSPTFVIFRKYKVKKNKNIKQFYHFDLYRLNSLDEIIDLGLEEIINDKNNVVAIEWADKIRKILPKNTLNIKIIYKNKNTRKILINSN